MVGDRLRAVNNHGDAVVVRHLDHFLYGVDGSQYIGNVRDGNHFGTSFQQFFVLLQIQNSLVVHRYYQQFASIALDHLLPRYKVAVVLHCRNQHFELRISLAHVIPALASG